MRRRTVGAGLLLLLAAAGALAWWGWRDFTAPGPLAETRRLIAPKGAGLTALAALLAREGAIRDPLIFRAFVMAGGDQHRLRAGEYDFPPGASAALVRDMLVEGRTVVRRVTIPEGVTTAEALALLRAAEGLVGEAPDPGEGRLLPETYHYSHGDSRAGLVARMRQAMDEALAEAMSRRAAGSPLGTPLDLLTLASIIEKETGKAGERARIAGVLVNRLKRGMRLQTDPTVIYALTGGKGPLDRPLRRADLRLEHPYNTYRIEGLPPGPIANPGRAALEAAARPAATEALYFVADGEGGHSFARSLREHNRNVARYRSLAGRKR